MLLRLSHRKTAPHCETIARECTCEHSLRALQPVYVFVCVCTTGTNIAHTYIDASAAGPRELSSCGDAGAPQRPHSIGVAAQADRHTLEGTGSMLLQQDMRRPCWCGVSRAHCTLRTVVHEFTDKKTPFSLRHKAHL